MIADGTHHFGLLATDLDESARFYMEAFDGRWLLRPVTLDGAAAEMIMNGPPGTAFKICLIALAKGCVGLHQFVGEVVPEWAGVDKRAAVPHIGIRVEDTDAALVQIERAGGRRLWDEVLQWGPARVIFAADPSGNVLEVIDIDVESVAAGMIDRFPQAAP